MLRGWLDVFVLGLVQGTLLTGAALLSLSALARLSAARRHTFLLALLIALLIVPIVLRALPSLVRERTSSNAPFVVKESARAAQPNQPALAANDTELTTSLPVPISPRRDVAVSSFIWLRIIFGAWCLGVLVQLARFVAGLVAVARLKRGARPLSREERQRVVEALGVVSAQRVLISAEARAPMTLGFLQVRIVLPAALIDRLIDDELRDVLLHELAHVERRDVWACAAQRLVEVFLYYHPLSWLLSRRLQVERERACDERVVAHTGAPRAYARSLLRVATLTTGAAPLRLASSAPGSGLTHRVEELLRPGQTLSSRLRVAAMLTALALLTVAASAPRIVFQRQVSSLVSLKGSSDTKAIGDRIDATLQSYVPHGFSGVVLVAKGDEIVLHKAYGLADREHHIAMTTGTYFSTAGMTKALTAADLLLLEQDGKLRTSDSVARYIGQLPGAKNAVTLHHLLTHSDGLVRAGAQLDVATEKAFVAAIKQTPIAYTPGSATRYTDIGYSLLGVIIERVSGESYEKFSRERVLTPAGMTETRFESETLPAGAVRAVEYSGPVGRQEAVAPRAYTWGRRGALGLVTTAGDLFRLLLASERAFGADVRSRLFTPRSSSNYGTMHGYGWDVVGDQGGLLHRRLAGTPGFEGELLNNLEEGWSAVILVNSAVGWRYAVWDEISLAFKQLPAHPLDSVLVRRHYAPYQGGSIMPVRTVELNP